MNEYICPKGHASSEPDYCSECGAKMQSVAAPAQSAAPPPVVAAAELVAGPEHCPDCGTARDQRDIAFCEICGYNFVTGAHGDAGAVPAAPATPTPAPAVLASSPGAAWIATLAIDPALHGDGSPPPPAGIGPSTFALAAPASLIGRRSEQRGIVPDIAVQHDDAVSHRHAILQLDPAGALSVRDIGSSNGTQLNGNPLTPLVDYPLKDGDVLAFGHWSTLTLSHGTSSPDES